jgi:ribosomal-protein-alanine N-acetyltransferase
MELNKDLFINGEKIYLRALKEADIEGNYRFWLNDPEVVRYNSHGRFPHTPEKLLHYIKSVLPSDTDLVLAVIEKESGRHIGNISLQKINWIDRNAEIAFLLGEKNFQGRGIMSEAGRLMIRHGFNALNLHRIYCSTSSENTGMRKLAEKLGLLAEGLRKEAIFKNGKYSDIVEYGILNKS